MLNPGQSTLFAGNIVANTDRNSGGQSIIANLDGMLALSIVMQFNYGDAGF